MEETCDNMHPSVRDVLQHFDYRHLPPHLAATSKLFAELAFDIARRTTGPETTVAIRKLLEAKDAAVRATKVSDPVVETCNAVLRALRETPGS